LLPSHDIGKTVSDNLNELFQESMLLPIGKEPDNSTQNNFA